MQFTLFHNKVRFFYCDININEDLAMEFERNLFHLCEIKFFETFVASCY